MNDEKYVVARMYREDKTADEVIRYIVENRIKHRKLAKSLRKAGLSRGSFGCLSRGGGMNLYTAQEFLAACGYRLKVEVVE